MGPATRSLLGGENQNANLQNQPESGNAMNKLLFAVAALLATSTAAAGVRIETITRDVKTKVVDGGAQIMLVQDGKVRMQIPKTSGGMILKNSILYVLDDKKKTYMEMDKETMRKGAEQAGAAM